ncbi:hypothetical protein OCU04_000147 [Sclerotinia nivalis]|uniref:Uncharacterized protein n=1 Tax=Sclerotinia nivalis TaxID=352851 RepID=A0A9X0DR06_9HELO|nr:hypothetical protein OCU04_000147 [Sclerotinia nivalis]
MTKQPVKGFIGEQATLCRGEYRIEPTVRILVLLGAVLCNKIHMFMELPFGNGVGAYIGRASAWQEAMMVTAMFLQNFDFRLHNAGYKLHIKQTFVITPKDLVMRATLRYKMRAMDLKHLLRGSLASGLKAAGSTMAPFTGVLDISRLKLSLRRPFKKWQISPQIKTQNNT